MADVPKHRLDLEVSRAHYPVMQQHIPKEGRPKFRQVDPGSRAV
jgi:hypothetical protein